MQAQAGTSGMLGQWWRLTGIAGIVWIVLFVVGAFVLQGNSPSSGDSIADIRKYFADDATKYLAGDFIIAIAFIFFFLPFVVGLRWVLGSVEDGPPILSWLTVIGAALATITGGIAGTFFGAMAVSAKNDYQLDDSTIRALMQCDTYAFTGLQFPVALFVGAASLVMIRTGIVWRWLGALGLLAAVLIVIGAAWPIDGDDMGAVAFPGFIGFIGLLLWVLITSIALIIRKDPPPSTERPIAR